MESSQAILDQIIKPCYRKYFVDWIDTASQNEARGLQLMSAIYKHKGRKKFKANPPSIQLKALTEQQAFDYKKAEEMYRKNQVSTTYGNFFGYLQKDLKPQTNVFKYKKISDLDLSKPLSNLAVIFIDNWIELDDELEFQELILSTLRVKAQEVAKSETKNEFASTNVDWKLCKPLRMDKAGNDLKTYKTNYNAIFKQRLKQEEINEKLKKLEETEGKENLKLLIKKSFKI